MALLPDLCDRPGDDVSDVKEDGDDDEEEEEEDDYVFHNPLSLQPLVLPTLVSNSDDFVSSEMSTTITATFATTVVPDVVDFQRWENERTYSW